MPTAYIYSISVLRIIISFSFVLNIFAVKIFILLFGNKNQKPDYFNYVHWLELDLISSLLYAWTSPSFNDERKNKEKSRFFSSYYLCSWIYGFLIFIMVNLKSLLLLEMVCVERIKKKVWIGLCALYLKQIYK